MNSSFEGNTTTGTDEWLTPPEIIKSFPAFDLDPCSPINRPFDTAKKHYTIEQNGLLQEWEGLVYCNPPYGKAAEPFLKKCAEHKNAIVLIFARTETNTFFNYVWQKADSVLFIKGRLNFYNVNGERSKNSAGAPSVLIAYNEYTGKLLKESGIKGKFLKVN